MIGDKFLFPPATNRPATGIAASGKNYPHRSGPDGGLLVSEREFQAITSTWERMVLLAMRIRHMPQHVACLYQHMNACSDMTNRETEQ